MSRKMRFRPLLLALAAMFVASGCQKPEIIPGEPFKDYARPLPPGQLALRKLTDPADYPDFSRDIYNRGDLFTSVSNSIEYLNKPSSKKYFPYGEITHSRAVASLERFRELLTTVSSGEELNEIIRRDFDVYQSIGYDGSGTVYFTGYYCPIFEGRRQREGRFVYPIYSLPDDLAKDTEGRTLGRSTGGGQYVPYPTRRGIEESNLLAGKEIAWLRDPFEAYVVTVQGSAKLRLADGSLFELGYAGNNGHTYSSVGQKMVEDGLIDRNELSLQRMIEYFAAHPAEVRKYCWANDRYVFFKEVPGGPFGSLGTPVTPYRTVATDKEVYPRACVAFLQADLPRATRGSIRVVPYSAFTLDQDTGGAIRAAGRCDIFMGTGPSAEALAGRTGAEGKLYYIFLKQELTPPPIPE